jgi:leishmanolysin
MSATIGRTACRLISWGVLWFLQILVLLLWAGMRVSAAEVEASHWHDRELAGRGPQTHSCIHDEILEQQRRAGVNQYKITPQVYEISGELVEDETHARRALLDAETDVDKRQPIRIFLNYDAVGHSVDRDCRVPGEIVKLGEPAPSTVPGFPACNSRVEPPIYGDCWYNCTVDDITGEDKKNRLHDALGETASWFRRALSVERVKGPLRLSGYSACGQDGGVQLPRQYVDGELQSQAAFVRMVAAFV